MSNSLFSSSIRPLIIHDNIRNGWLVLAIVATTALLWCGAVRVGFSTDDYLFIQKLAPIRTFADVVRPFWHLDPNPPYWRPLANASAALDFLMWGWNGKGFHLTNFVLHLIATGLVFFLAKKVLRLPVPIAAVTALLFGIAASHESNILWPAARADTFVTIFTMFALLFETVALEKKRGLLFILSVSAYLLALSSKENGILALPLLIALVEYPAVLERKLKWKAAFVRIIPYLVVTVLFWIYRSHYTTAMEDSEVLLSEGSHSIIAFLRNAVYGIGYALVPLDLEQATALLRHQSFWIWMVPIVLFAVVIFFWLRLPKQEKMLYMRPALFFVIAAIVTMQSFERWRYYMPSIGLFALLAILAHQAWNHSRNRLAKAGMVVVLCIFVFFHIWRAISAENNWRIAANEVQTFKADLIAILRNHSERPMKLDLLDVPAKLGSASVMQVGLKEIVRQAEAERMDRSELRYGVEESAILPVEKAVDIYAFNISKEYSGIIFETDSSGLTLTSNSGSKILFDPALFKIGDVSRRDWNLHAGDTFDVGPNRVTILEAEGSFARSVKIEPLDRSWFPVYFDGGRFRAFP